MWVIHGDLGEVRIVGSVEGECLGRSTTARSAGEDIAGKAGRLSNAIDFGFQLLEFDIKGARSRPLRCSDDAITASCFIRMQTSVTD